MPDHEWAGHEHWQRQLIWPFVPSETFHTNYLLSFYRLVLYNYYYLSDSCSQQQEQVAVIYLEQQVACGPDDRLGCAMSDWCSKSNHTGVVDGRIILEPVLLRLPDLHGRMQIKLSLRVWYYLSAIPMPETSLSALSSCSTLTQTTKELV